MASQYSKDYLIIFSDTLCRITRVRNIVHLRNFGTLFIYYSSTIFNFLTQFIESWALGGGGGGYSHIWTIQVRAAE